MTLNAVRDARITINHTGGGIVLPAGVDLVNNGTTVAGDTQITANTYNDTYTYNGTNFEN